jgi:hypothetical protein
VTPAQARDWLLTLPAEQREAGRRALRGTWDDGFGAGSARLPRINPHDSTPPAALPEKTRGKTR